MRIRGFRHRLVLYITTGALFLVVMGSAYQCRAQGARFGHFRIYVTASPPRVAADGQTRARVRVEVRDDQGQHVPDNTPVFISIDPPGQLSEATTNKRPSLTVRTASGFAIAFATSDTPGTLAVEARVQDSRNYCYIDFLPKDELAAPAARVIDIRGGWVGYSVDFNMVEALDDAEAEYGGVTVAAADKLQLDVGQMILKARPVVVQRGAQQLSGEDLYFDLRSRRGAVRKFSQEGSERVFFDIYNLEPRDFDWDLPYNAFRFNNEYSQTILVADSISVFVGEKIVLRHAKMYIDGEKAMSLPPYWIIGMPGYTGAANTQVLGFSSDGGLAVNFPVFYRVTDHSTGAVEIQRGARASSVIARRGWSLGLREDYRRGDVEGSIVVGGLPRSDWGVEWRDRRPVLGGAMGDFSIAWPDHHNVFVDANIFDYRDSYQVNLWGYYDRVRDLPDTYGVNADWLTTPRRLSSDGRDTFRLGTSLGLRHNSSEKDGIILDNELYGALDFHPWRLGRQAWLTPSISNVYSWDTADYSANSARGSLRLRKYFGKSVDLYVDYSTAYGSGDAYRTGWRQVLSSYLWADGNRWAAYLSSSWDLTESDTYADLEFNYYLNKRWRLGLLGTYYKSADTKFDDLELIASRRVWQDLGIGLRYSQDSGKFSLELSGLGRTF